MSLAYEIFDFFQDAHTVDYGDIKQGSTNITTLRLIDSQRHMVQAAVQDWVFSEQRRGKVLRLSPETLQVKYIVFKESFMIIMNYIKETIFI